MTDWRFWNIMWNEQDEGSNQWDQLQWGQSGPKDLTKIIGKIGRSWNPEVGNLNCVNQILVPQTMAHRLRPIVLNFDTWIMDHDRPHYLKRYESDPDRPILDVWPSTFNEVQWHYLPTFMGNAQLVGVYFEISFWPILAAHLVIRFAMIDMV